MPFLWGISCENRVRMMGTLKNAEKAALQNIGVLATIITGLTHGLV